MAAKHTLSEALKTIRKARGLSQEAFSDVSSRTYMSTLERDLKSPTLNKLAELPYGKMPQLEQKLKALEKRHSGEGTLISQEVTADQIAEVVSACSGVPVTRLLEGENKAQALRIQELETEVGQLRAMTNLSPLVVQIERLATAISGLEQCMQLHDAQAKAIAVDVQALHGKLEDK